MVKRKRGRPKLPASEKRGTILKVCVTKQELARFNTAAEKSNLSLSKWARHALEKST